MKKILIICFSLLAYAIAPAQDISVQDYINTYKDIAISEMKRTGIPASITIAQGILETENGNSVLVKKSNNHFGIKCKNTWTGASVSHDDDAQGECFRKYETAIDSYRDHSNFLRGSSRYAFLFNLDPLDYKGWAYGLKKAGYATNPRYPQILIKNIETYNLQQYDLPEGQTGAWQTSAKQDSEVMEITEKPAPVNTASKTSVKQYSELPAKTVKPVTANREVAFTEMNIEKNTESIKSGRTLFNGLKAVYAPSGTSLLAIATRFDIPLLKLLEYNDLKADGLLDREQWIFLEMKQKAGNRDFCIAGQGETLYSISQVNAIQLGSLLSYNSFSGNEVLKKGTKVRLRPVKENTAAKAKPREIVHEVKPKEGLYAISKMYNVPIQAIRDQNSLSNDELTVGQQLIITKQP